jgi:hypothetical protein
VPEYDAFGREIGEDPLEAFAPAAPTRRPEPEVAWPDPEPAPEPVVAAPRPAPPEFVRSRRPRSGGLARVVVILAVLCAGGVALVSAGTTVDGGVEDIAGTSPATGAGGGGSLIRRASFAGAVRTLAGAGLGRPLTMRVAPDRIDATLVARGGRVHQVQITAGGALRELASGAGAPARTIPYVAIDPAAPQRLVRAGATKRVPAGSIDYLVLTAGPQWAAYYKGGRIVIGDAHGRRQRVL